MYKRKTESGAIDIVTLISVNIRSKYKLQLPEISLLFPCVRCIENTSFHIYHISASKYLVLPGTTSRSKLLLTVHRMELEQKFPQPNVHSIDDDSSWYMSQCTKAEGCNCQIINNVQKHGWLFLAPFINQSKFIQRPCKIPTQRRNYMKLSFTTDCFLLHL